MAGPPEPSRHERWARDINVELKNLQSDGDITVITAFFEINSEVNADQLIEVLFERIPERARDSIAGGDWKLSDGTFIKSTSIERAKQATVSAINAVAMGDELALSCMRSAAEEICKFVVTHIDFAKDLVSSGAVLSIGELAEQIGRWLDKNPHSTSNDERARIVGTAEFLSFRYSKALHRLGGLAKRLHDPDLSERSGRAALFTAHYAVALDHLEAAERHFRVNGPEDERRLALLISDIGACHDGLIATADVDSTPRDWRTPVFDTSTFQTERAISRFRQALTFLSGEKLDRLDQLARALVLGNLGCSLMLLASSRQQRDAPSSDTLLQEAEVVLNEALAIREERFDIAPNKVNLLLNLADLANQQDDHRKSQRLISRAIGMLDAFKYPSRLQARVKSMQAQYLIVDGEYREARRLLETAMEILERNSLGNEEDILWLEYFHYCASCGEGVKETDVAIRFLFDKAIKFYGDENAPFVQMIAGEIIASVQPSPPH